MSNGATAPTAAAVTRRTFERTVSPHLPALQKRARRLTRGNDAAAEDLVQDALVRAFRFWHTFTPGTGAAQWLYTILRNTHATAYQRANRRTEVMEAHKAAVVTMETGRPPGVVEAMEALETQRAVREAVAALPEQYREAVRLADLEGCSYREVAETLGCPEGTVMSRLYRGRKRLAGMLAGAA